MSDRRDYGRISRRDFVVALVVMLVLFAVVAAKAAWELLA